MGAAIAVAAEKEFPRIARRTVAVESVFDEVAWQASFVVIPGADPKAGLNVRFDSVAVYCPWALRIRATMAGKTADDLARALGLPLSDLTWHIERLVPLSQSEIRLGATFLGIDMSKVLNCALLCQQNGHRVKQPKEKQPQPS